VSVRTSRVCCAPETTLHTASAASCPQGRLPIRVSLKGLTQEDFYRILTEPQTNLIEQQQVG
jgi:ATP-dependent protease HslVU (ClpYQ) ATPase subunit